MDTISKKRRSKNMAAIRSKDTAPEVLVRKVVHRLGFRFRIHRNELPGKPDLVLSRYRSIIFVHGCFWHQHSLRACLDGRKPKSNLGYWLPKLRKNVARDKKNREKLRRLGWHSLTIWECQTKDPKLVARRIKEFLR